jgi:hypothetical protein
MGFNLMYPGDFSISGFFGFAGLSSTDGPHYRPEQSEPIICGGSDTKKSEDNLSSIA